MACLLCTIAASAQFAPPGSEVSDGTLQQYHPTRILLSSSTRQTTAHWALVFMQQQMVNV